MTPPQDDALATLRAESLAERFLPELRLSAEAEGGAELEAPPSFWERAARVLLAKAPGSSRSALFEWYDLFNEFGARHAGSGRVAFTDYSASMGLQSTSYPELVDRALALTKQWTRAGVGPGCTVCLIFDPRATYLASLLAAWHCGASVCVVPPSGPEFVQRALEQAAAHVNGRLFAVVCPKAATWVDASVELLVWRPESTNARVGSPHRFEAGETAAYLFSPLTVDWFPLPVSAEQLYLSALRDALLLLQLEPSDIISAPGFCDLQFKPSLILASLAAGAEWVEFDQGELHSWRVLQEAKVSVLGVAPVTRRLLGARGASVPSSVRRWFRNVAETTSDEWTEVQAKLARAQTLGMNYFANAATPGALLFSDWTSNPCACGVLRAPGLACELTEPNGTEMPQLSDVGTLSPVADFEPGPGQRMLPTVAATGRIVLAQTRCDNVWVANLGSHRDGKLLPEPLIEGLLLRRYPKQVRAAIIVSLPARQRDAVVSDRLVVFARPSEPPLLAAEVEGVLKEAFGVQWSPRSVTVFELNPALLAPDDPQSEVDRAGCAAQYLAGILWAKARAGPVFRELARLGPELSQVMRHHSERTEGAASIRSG